MMNGKIFDTIWHYTSMEVMLQIVGNGTLRFSSAAHLNDTHEISWVEEVFQTARERDDANNLNKESLELLASSVIGRDFAERTSPFVVAFSLQPDKLSQWRAYADDGKGIAIGFRRDWLMSYLDKKHTNTGLTIYCQPVQYLSDNASTLEIYQTFKFICDENRTRFRIEDDTEPINRLASFFIKNAAFREEEEYRLCYDFASFQPGNTSANRPREEYRATADGRIVPFVDFKICDPGEKIPITDVMLGSRNVNSMQSIKQYFWKHENSTPTIERSKATYRI